MRTITLALAAAGLATTASAHVLLETASAPANSTFKAVLQVPHGCSGQATERLAVKLPAGFIDAKPMPKAGWTLAVTRGAYDRPYELYGETLTEGPVEIVWSGGKLEDSEYDEFVIRGRVADLAEGSVLAFPTTQSCASGEVAWTEVAASGQDPHALKSPAPVLTVGTAAAAADEHAGHVHGGGAAPAAVGSASAGDLAISAAWMRGTPPGAPVAGGYLAVTNNGSTADRLLGGSAPFADRVEIHEMTTVDGLMRMKPIAGGLPIGPGATVTLSPGGDHVMFMGVKGAPKPGETAKVTLTFEHAGAVEVDMPVSAIGAQAAP